jgi:hypothetical protein
VAWSVDDDGNERDWVWSNKCRRRREWKGLGLVEQGRLDDNAYFWKICRIRTQLTPKPNKKYLCSRKLVWMTTCKIFITTWKIRVTYIGVWDLVIRTSHICSCTDTDTHTHTHHNICTGKPRWDLLTNMWRGDGTHLLQIEGSLTGKVDVRGGVRGRKEWGRCPDNWFVFQTFYYDQQKIRSVFFSDGLFFCGQSCRHGYLGGKWILWA